MPYTVLTLRDCDDYRFATNWFHETWHILSDWRGAKVLSQLLWGLAYQSRPGTIVVIDPARLQPNPFDAEPANPVVLVQSPLTGFPERAARDLKRQFPWRSKPAGTVRWQTFGLRRAIEATERERAKPWSERAFQPDDRSRETVRQRSGVIVYAGDTGALRAAAIATELTTRHSFYGSNCHFLADGTGEIQIFRRFRAEVSIARQARAEVLATQADYGDQDSLRQAIWAQAEKVRRRRLPAVSPSTGS